MHISLIKTETAIDRYWKLTQHRFYDDNNELGGDPQVRPNGLRLLQRNKNIEIFGHSRLIIILKIISKIFISVRFIEQLKKNKKFINRIENNTLAKQNN
ncbi:hypothetical protein BpHYR1_044020 [Brachionus plicatilis]|uniref:Uncharacterized protein n=1 Tax=Brachionus plicatilis TaxID=10195 RepID=A0A3M7PZZ8_BRAPC|nr:hypothetical protein BpHYR1_044020 [Brachionus plicatilis]